MRSEISLFRFARRDKNFYSTKKIDISRYLITRLKSEADNIELIRGFPSLKFNLSWQFRRSNIDSPRAENKGKFAGRLDNWP